jgi:hypothetical protein
MVVSLVVLVPVEAVLVRLVPVEAVLVRLSVVGLSVVKVLVVVEGPTVVCTLMQPCDAVPALSRSERGTGQKRQAPPVSPSSQS